MRNFNFLFSNSVQGESDLTRYCPRDAFEMPLTCPRHLFCKVLILSMLLMVIGVGNVWGAETTKTTCVGTGSGYGTRRTATYNSIGWVLSTGQEGYLGTSNSTGHGNTKPTADDLPVVKAQYASATTSTTGYYYYYTTTAIANVTKIEFSYTGKKGSATVNAYVVSSSTAASSGSATWSQPTLASGTGLSAQGANIASATGTYTFKLNAKETSSKYYGIILKTGSYSRLTTGTIKIYVDDAAAYTITVTRNNNSYGTASLSGTTITADPEDCYQVISGTGGYTVTSGTATVSHTGTSNTLTVTPSTNCTVQVNFEKKTVNTYVDEIQDYGTTEGCETEAPSLEDKTPATSGTCVQQHWHFMGWVTAANKANPTDLNIITPGTTIAVDGSTYYAVWAKGEGSVFDGSTEGTYLIYANDNGTNYYATNTVSSNSLQTTSSVGSAQEFTFAKSGDYWTISYKSGNSTYYLTASSTATINAFSTTSSTWRISSGTYGTWRIWSSSTNSGSDAYAYRALMLNSSHAFKNYCPDDDYLDCEIGTPIEFSDYICACCTPLGTINGSVSWSNGQATVSWDAAAGCSSWTLKYKAHADSDIPANWTTYDGAFGTAADRTSNSTTISGLTAGTEYDFKITGTSNGTTYCAGEVGETTSSTVPQIIASGDLTGSDYAYNDGSGTVKTFDVSGVGLVAGSLTFSVPTSPAQLFEISTDNGVSWGSSKTLAISAGTLSATTIKVRLKAGFSIGSYGPHTITISGGGAADNTGVTIAGSVTSACTEPTVATPTLTSIASGTITVSCASVTVDENCDVTEYGFVWNESSDPTISDNKNAIATTYADNFSKALSISFTTGTTYKIKAYAVNSAGTTLSATLSVTPQSVTFVSNGGSSVATAYVNNGGTVSKPSNPTLANYDFDNWYTDDKTFVSAVDFSSAITEDKTYYAKWTETLHDVTVEYKCGSTTVKASTTIENVGVVTTGSTTAPNDITGYTWSTWSAMPSGVTTSTTPLTTRDITINATADGKTITANYTANQYAITYKDKGDVAYSGNNEGSLPSIHTYGSATALIDGTKTGYHFDGWFTDAACTENAGGSIGATAKTAAFTLYAKWTPNDYDVTLKANGGTSSDQVVSATYDAAMPATVKAGTDIVVPTYNGYTFGGYYDNADYTMGTQYYTDALASAHNWDKASTANLYGRWIPNEYVVTLDANGGVDGATTSVNTTFGQAMPTIAAANLPTREGYRFDGFYTEKSGGTQYYYANGTSAKNQARYSANQKLYAHWVAQLKFSVNGAIDGTLTRDDNTAMPSTATVPASCGDCWSFMGWSTDDEEDEAAEYAGGATHEFGEPTTLYAVYGKTEYKLISDLSDLEANEYYVLSALNSNEYAMSNTTTDTYYATSVDITSDLKENADGWYLYNPPVSVIWKFTGTTSSGRLYNEAASKYLDLSSNSATILQSSTSDYLKFTKFDSELFNIASTTQTSYFLYMYSDNKWSVDDNHDGYSSCYIYKRQSAEYTTEPSCETYDIVWKVNDTPLASGSQTEETNECTGIEDLPANPEDDALDCATKFMGWSEYTLIGTGQSAPADLFTDVADAPAIDADKTFHAVFASVDAENTTTVTDNLTCSLIGITGTSYTEWSDKSDNSPAVYAGKSCESSTNKVIQIKSKDSNTGIVTTISGGKAKKITITWSNENSSSRTIDIYGKNSPYSDATDLYSEIASTQGNKLGSIVYGTSTELTITGDYSYIGIRSNDGAAYLSNVAIKWESAAYKDYMTMCCDHLVTLSDGSPANGTVTFDPAGSVETCTGAKEVSMTITPNPGYYLSGWSSSGVAPTSVVPAVVTNTADAQTTTLTFAEGSNNGTYTAGATFTAKALEGWTWMYKKDADVADNSVDPYEIPDVVEIYKDQYARFIITGYAPADVIAEKQGYVYTAGGVEPKYTTDYLTRVANPASYFTLKGKNPVESTTITFKAIGDASITRTMTIRVKALPLVHFVDNVHNVAFEDVVATVETGVVTLTKKTPTQDDFDGTTKNTCEETHLHLVGWIDGDWTPYQAYMNGTGEKPTVSAIIGATGYFYAPNVDIDLVAKDGKTFYAVWANVE